MALTAACTIPLASPSPTKLNYFRIPTASSLRSRPLLSLSTTGASRLKLNCKGDKLITAYSCTGYGGGNGRSYGGGGERGEEDTGYGDGIGNGRSYGGGAEGGEEDTGYGGGYGGGIGNGRSYGGGGEGGEEDTGYGGGDGRSYGGDAEGGEDDRDEASLLQSRGLDLSAKMPMAVVMEYGAGVLFKAEYEKRKERFSDNLGVVYADLTMAANADFMRVRHPTTHVSLPPTIPFQAALGGTSDSILNRLSATLRSRTMLVVGGTASALVATIVADNLINAKKPVRSEPEDISLSTRVKYGLCMALVTNLGYQLLAGGAEPYSHQRKLMLNADCDFQVLTESQSGSQMPRKTAFRLNGAIGLKSSYMALTRSKGSE